ncbi:MAG: hypothetical protein KBG84_03245 [Planctomycetes bacterium]|nr:hypothetical protein [Planctomycetota bacterium]
METPKLIDKKGNPVGGAGTSGEGGIAAAVTNELAWLGADAAILWAAVAMGTAPDVTTMAQWGAAILATGAIGDMLVHFGRLTNLIAGDEIVPESQLKIMEMISSVLQLVGSLVTLPYAATQFQKAVATLRLRTDTAIRNGGKSVTGAKTPAGNTAKAGKDANLVGATREQRVADLVGGKLAKDANGQDILLKLDQVGSVGLDVIGPNGEYILVGGNAKCLDMMKFGQKLGILKKIAERDGKIAKYYFEKGTSEELLEFVRNALGKDNVHVF